MASYFKPRHVSGLGTFQDGGLLHDPGSLALQEVAAIYPYTDEPSLVVSLGTGSPQWDDVPRMSPSRGILKDGFIPRLFRALLLSLGSNMEHKFRSRFREGRKEQYFRLDFEFDDPEPALDDVTRMQEVKAAARSAVYGSKELGRLARCVVAELFIFELEPGFRKEKGQYLCVGRIFCRLRANGTALGMLLNQLTTSSAKFLFEGRPLGGSLKDGSYLDGDGNFNKRVAFEIHDRRSPISILLQDGSLQPCSISGSPYSIDALVAAQHLEDSFGRADHVKRKRMSLTDTLCRKRRRWN
jgi:hypothetical protein